MGKIENVRIIRDRETFIGKGFAYIEFNNKEIMQKAIAEMNGSKFNGRELRVKKAVEAKRMEKKKKKREEKFDRKKNKKVINQAKAEEIE
mmetsp:Transcript_35373/g.34408  ORF Transcript_35373/g.34408 Transcript_35373/m.34408 type:complete len:90 (+) Transcript_35373:367-636(+)